MGLERDSVYISFQLTGKEKDVTKCFNLALSVDKPWIWTKAIERILSLDSRQVKEKTCRTVNSAIQGSLLNHVLCITQKRIVVAKFLNRSYLKKTMLLIALVIPGAPLWFISSMVFVLTIIGALRGWTVSMLFADSLYLMISIPGWLLTWIPIFASSFLRKRRFRHLAGSEPQNILDTESRSFEIPYSEITQLKIKKKRFGQAQKVEVVTKNETRILKFAKRQEFLGFRQVIQRFLPERKVIVE